MIAFILISLVASSAADCSEDKINLWAKAEALQNSLKYCYIERADALSKVYKLENTVEESLTTCRNEMEQFITEMGGLQRGHKIMTQGKLYKGWTIKLDIKPVGTRPMIDWNFLNGNIVHVQTADETFVTGLWFHNHFQLNLRPTVNSEKHNYEFSNLTLHEWSTVTISHLKISNMDRYLLKVEIDGKELIASTNTSPVEYENVMIFGSGPAEYPALAFIRNLEVTTTPNL